MYIYIYCATILPGLLVYEVVQDLHHQQHERSFDRDGRTNSPFLGLG